MNATTTAETLFREIVDRFGPELASQHRWFDENERWAELIFAVATKCTTRDQQAVRKACESLLGAGILDDASSVRRTEFQSAASLALQEHGFTAEEAARAVNAISDLAETIDLQFAGKVQLYLRERFQSMNRDMVTRFAMRGIDKEDAQQIFALWLQNVCSAPISIADPRALEYCSDSGVAWDDMVLLADTSDINLALLDDLIHAASDSTPTQHTAQKAE